MKINIVQKKVSKQHNDSVWYDGELANAETKKGTKLSLVACGDIRIHTKEGELVFDGKERNSGIKGGFNSDKDLKKIGYNYTDKYYWENNNWFEIVFEKMGEGVESVIGDVVYGYDEAIELLKSYGDDY